MAGSSFNVSPGSTNYNSLGDGLLQSTYMGSSYGAQPQSAIQDYGTGRLQLQLQQQAQQADLQRQFQAQQDALNRQVQLAPLQFKEDTFNKLFPYLQNGLTGKSNTVGGTPAPQPAFTPSPVYTNDQMNQQVNAAVAGNDQKYQTQERLQNQSQAAQGFGAQSPIMQAMRNQLMMGNQAENATAQRQIPFQAAQANSDSLFRGNQLQQQMWQSADQSDIARRQQQLSQFNSLIGLLGGI